MPRKLAYIKFHIPEKEFFKNKKHLLKYTLYLIVTLILAAAISHSLSRPPLVQADSLISFNEGYGSTVHDSSGSASGTIHNAAWKPESLCYSDSCLYFDGTRDYVDFGDDNSFDFTASTNFTINLWFRHTGTLSGTQVLLAKYNSATGTDGGYKLYMNSNGTLTFGIDDDQASFPEDFVTSTNSYNDSQWHFVSAIKTGTSRIELYVDSIRVGSDTSLSATGTLVNSDPLYLGIDGDGSSNGWVGFIDDFKIYTSTTRSESEIKSDFTGQTTSRGVSESFGPDNSNISDGLIGYWNMDNITSGSTDEGPTNIDDASDFGVLSGMSRQLLRNSSGDLYAVLNDSGSCEVWKSTDGTSWSEQDSSNNPACTSNPAVFNLSARIDDTGIIHIVYLDSSELYLYYITFNTNTDLFSSTEQVGGLAGVSPNQFDMEVDSNEIPHLAIWDDTADDLRYTNRIGGSWKSSSIVVENLSSVSGYAISMTINSNDYVEIVNLTNYLNENLIAYKAITNNPTQTSDFNTQVVGGVVNTTSGQTGATIGIDSDNNTWVSFITEDGPNDYVMLRKHNSSDDWNTWQSSITDYKAGNEPSIAIDGNDVYIFYQDDQNDVVYDMYNGAWSGETTLQTGTYRDVKAKWSYLNNYGSDNTDYGAGVSGIPEIDYLYSDGTDIYWASLGLAKSITPDSSGSGMNLYNNNLVTTTSGKYGNAANFSAASSQYFIPASTINHVEYYFNDSNPEDADSVWYDDTNAFDGSTSNSASSTQVLGQNGENQLVGYGTNAPSSGSEITSVQARVYGSANTDFTYDEYVKADIWTENYDENLGTPYKYGQSIGWGSYETLNPPDGGWTYDQLSNLEVHLWGEASYSGIFHGNAYKVELLTSERQLNTYPSGIKTISFWVKPTSANSYILTFNSSKFIYTLNGQVKTSYGITNPQIYVNGVKGDKIPTNSWSYITVTTDTVIDASSFTLGKANGIYFNGSIDELRIYNRTISPTEIRELYNWAPGPVAWWKLDEGTGTSTAYDSSGNALNGTLYGSPAWIPGKYGPGLKIVDAKDQWVDVPSSSDLGFTTPFTVSAWTYTDLATTSQTIASKDGTATVPTDRGYQLTYDSSGNFKAYIFNNSGNACNNSPSSTISTSTTTYQPGTWYYVTQVYDGTKQYLYVNGALEDSDATSGTSCVAANDFEIGSRNDGSSNMTGGIDEVKIYNYARTPAQIISDMNAGHPAPGSPVGSPYLWYKFDTGFNTTAYNTGNGGAGLNGTITSGTWTNAGRYDKALVFTASTSVTATITDPGYANTISMWVYPTTSAASKTLVTSGKLTTDASSRPVYGGCTGKPLSPDTWTHLLAVSDSSGSCSIYQNGVKTASGTTGVTFGTSVNIGGSSFTGTIDEFKLYNLAMTADQAAVEYTQGKASVWGSTGTNSSGTGDNSATRSYCPPGNTEGNCASGQNPAPVAEWRFNENGGTTVYDSSGNGNNSTTWTGNTAYTPGRYGSGLVFDGVNDVVRFAESSTTDLGTLTDSYTIEAWINTTSTSTNQAIVAKDYGNTTVPFRLSIGTSLHPCFYIYDNVQEPEACGTTAINDGKWHHLTGIRDVATDKVYIYVDGILANSVNDNTTMNLQNDIDISIGNAGNNYNILDFNGIIDDVRIFHYTRTPAQIAWDYNKGGPVGWWRFDECSGTTAHDASGNENNGTIYALTGNSVGVCDGTPGDMWADGKNGKINSSLYFNGASDYVSVNNDAVFDVTPTDDLTISGWFNLTEFVSPHVILSKYDENFTGYLVSIESTGSLNFILYDNLSNYFSMLTADTFQSSGWNHFTIVIDRDSETNSAIYINGTRASVTKEGSLSGLGDASNSGNLEIGVSTILGYYFRGQIDDVRIYKYALSPQQVQLLFTGSAVNFSL